MKIDYPITTRSNPVDRNPLSIMYHFQQSLNASWPPQQPFTYVCPLGKRALITSGWLMVTIISPATTPAITYVSLTMDDNNNTGIIGAVYMVKNAQGDANHVVIPSGLMLLGGQYIYATYNNDRTNGSTLVSLALTLLEYDI